MNDAAKVSDTIKLYLDEICVPATSIFNERIDLLEEDLKDKAETLRLKHEELLDRKYIWRNRIIADLDWCELHYYSDRLSLKFKETMKLPEKTV